MAYTVWGVAHPALDERLQPKLRLDTHELALVGRQERKELERICDEYKC